jgi:hypothetical protein
MSLHALSHMALSFLCGGCHGDLPSRMKGGAQGSRTAAFNSQLEVFDGAGLAHCATRLAAHPLYEGRDAPFE